MTARASAPASSANLGPGFDVLAIAFEKRCEVEVELADDWTIQENGQSRLATTRDFVVRAALAVAPQPLLIRINNHIPRSRGLGSSSAVGTAIAAAAHRIQGSEPSNHDLLTNVIALEGHADNAAASIYGNLVLVDDTAVHQPGLHSRWRFVAGIPNSALSTQQARFALPVTIERSVVVRSLARLGFLLEGLRLGDEAMLRRASGDEIHEAPRANLSPMTGTLIQAALGAGAAHAAWSGAGPTALAIVDESGIDTVISAMREALAGAGVVEELVVAGSGWA